MDGGPPRLALGRSGGEGKPSSGKQPTPSALAGWSDCQLTRRTCRTALQEGDWVAQQASNISKGSERPREAAASWRRRREANTRPADPALRKPIRQCFPTGPTGPANPHSHCTCQHGWDMEPGPPPRGLAATQQRISLLRSAGITRLWSPAAVAAASPALRWPARSFAARYAAAGAAGALPAAGSCPCGAARRRCQPPARGRQPLCTA